MNFDVTQLKVETDAAGFILGKSYLGEDLLRSAAESWVDIKDDFTAITLSRKVGVEKGILFRPETSTLSLRTRSDKYLDSYHGRQIKLTYKNTLLFLGIIKQVTMVATPGELNTFTITAQNSVEYYNRYLLYGFNRPTESTGNRIKAVLPEAVVTNCTRNMGSRGVAQYEEPTLLEVLQDAADVQRARFFLSADNKVHIHGEAAANPTVRFVDYDGSTDVEYKSLDFKETLSNTITTAVVTVKQNESITAIAQNVGAEVTSEQRYTIDLPATQADANAWASSFPTLSYVRLEPSTLSTGWHDALANIELTDRIRVVWQGREYDSGVVEMNHNITPRNWNVDLALVPAHVVAPLSLTAPAPVNELAIRTATTNSLQVSWQRPGNFGVVTGYRVRYKQGRIAPSDPSDGVLVGNYTRLVYPRRATASGLAPKTEYAFAVFALTSNNLVYSKATIIGKTL